MSEQLLRAIIELLAIVAIEDDITEDERKTVENFLRQNLNNEETKKYLSQFDQFANSIEKKILSESFDSKEEIKKLTSRINQELTVQQKVIVLLNLVEIIIADGQISDREKELLYYIGESFKFSSKVIDHLKAFVVNEERLKLNSQNILIVDSQDDTEGLALKHIRREHLDGFIAFFRLPKLEVYFLKYLGSTSLTLNGIPLKRNRLAVFSVGRAVGREPGGPSRRLAGRRQTWSVL